MITVTNLSKTFKFPLRKESRFAILRNLFSREFTTKTAVHNISFILQKGEIVGYIGKNGAGKSTTIKMLSGILQPTSGTISLNDINPSTNRKENAKQIGVVFGQKTQLWWDVPVIESYRLLKDIYKIDNSVYEKNLAQFTAMLGLNDILDKPVRQMSLGQRVKSDIVAALLHNPSVLFLDEPTIGVDALSKKALYDFILRINKERQVTVLLTTHDLKDIEKLCSRILIIDDGKIMYDGTLQYMTEKYGTTRTLVVDIENEEDDFEIPGAKLVSSSSMQKTYSFNRFETKPSQLIDYISKRCAITDLRVVEPEIEEVLRNLYNHDEEY